MAESPLDDPVSQQIEERFPPPMSLIDWTCHVVCWLLLAWCLFEILSNLSALRSAAQSATPGSGSAIGVIVIVCAMSFVIYAFFAVLTPFPRLYAYPFRLKPGEQRVVFPFARTMALIIAAQTTLIFALIIWDIIRTTAHGAASLSGPLVGAVVGIMTATVAFMLLRLALLHARYTPPTDSQAA